MRATFARLSNLGRHTLVSGSPFVRARGGVRSAAVEDDFTLFPTFFTSAESRQLLTAALWKLDRVDSTRRRRGAAKSPEEVHAGELQDMFTGEYGFEEVGV